MVNWLRTAVGLLDGWMGNDRIAMVALISNWYPEDCVSVTRCPQPTDTVKVL